MKFHSNRRRFMQVLSGGMGSALMLRPQSSCLNVSAAGAQWQNLAFSQGQAGSFVAEVDATPLAQGTDAGIGLANGPQTSFGGLACIARFNSLNRIDARNGGTYQAAASIPYFPNVVYHFRFVVNLPAHTYSVYVTPSGGNERTVALNYAFRDGQGSVQSLTYWSLFSDAGSMQACNFIAGCNMLAAGSGWRNGAFAAQTGSFSIELDATPSASPIDCVIALSNGFQTAFENFACLVRFNLNGNIDARNGDGYGAASTISYAPGTLYHFRFVVNILSHTYSVYVRPAGGPDTLVGQNFAFRSQQSSVSTLSNLGAIVDSATGSACISAPVVTSNASSVDYFGTNAVYPTIPGGREWHSKWANGHARTFGFGFDPDDPEFEGRGDGNYSIDGNGVLSASCPSADGGVRMYIYDPQFTYPSIQCGGSAPFDPNQYRTWNNVEITVYAMRVQDSGVAYAGLCSGAKIRHLPDEDFCGTRGYYGRFRNDGFIDFEKEINHNCGDVQTVTNAAPQQWPQLPFNQWIGYKFIARDANAGTQVKLELWLDTTDGANGGSWQLVHTYTDGGGWGAGFAGCAPGIDPAQILTGPNLSVFIRDDKVQQKLYKKWTIREINPA
jgi:hypothetical protein